MPSELVEAFFESPKLWLALLLVVAFLAGGAEPPGDLAIDLDRDE